MYNIVKLESGRCVEFQGDRNKSVHKGGSLLGKGGQGAVYLVKECDTERTFALKVYNTPVSNVFVENLRKNIANGAPNDSFVWPLDLTEPMGKNGDRYGYTMELFDYANYTSFARILKGKTTFPSKEKQIQTLMNLAKAIDSLHSRGLCYQDLNDGSVMFDCQNGKVLICDNDNIAPCGINIPFDSEGHCIQGKLKYMAPEVAAKILKPDEYSDRFSLAVLIFMILLHAHPFDGVKRLEGQLTVSVQEKIYGTEPVFIFHPTDKSNHPDPQIDINAIKAWPTIPDFIQDLFIKTFTSGMPAPQRAFDKLQFERQERPSAKEWYNALRIWLEKVNNIQCGSECILEEKKTVIDELNNEQVIQKYVGKELSIEKIYVSQDLFFTVLFPVNNCHNQCLAKDQNNNIVILNINGNSIRALDLNYTSTCELKTAFDKSRAIIVDVFSKVVSNQGQCIFIEWKFENELRCDVIFENDLGRDVFSEIVETGFLLDCIDDLF